MASENGLVSALNRSPLLRMTPSSLRCIGFVGFVLVPMLASWALPQSVEGLVTDPTGGVVVSAAVSLTNVETGRQLETATNEVGRYIFPSVSVGRYSLKVSAVGFKTFFQSNFAVVVSQRVTFDVGLQLGEVSDTVTVDVGGSTPLLEPTSNELGTLIDSKRIDQLPLNGRNFLQLGLLAGAAQPPGPGGDLAAAQGGHPDRTITIAGLQQDLTSYKINGISTSGSRLGHSELNLSIAAIDQFKVRQGFFLPGEGANPGIVDVVIKSGTNRFHGEVFEFFRGDELDARDFFALRDPSEFRRNQYGFGIGGPILKDKLFFFGNFEGLREHRLREVQAFTPTQAMFEGDFSELPVQIFDPRTFDPVTGKRQAFPGNRIPAAMINQVSKHLLQYYLPGSTYAARPFNLRGNRQNLVNSDQYTVRIDSNLTASHVLFGAFSSEDSPVTIGSLFPLSGTSFPLTTRVAMLQLNSSLSSMLLNELRLGWSRGTIKVATEEESDIQKRIGLTNSADPNGVPAIGFIEFGGFGNASGSNANYDNLYQFHDGVNYIRRDHQFQFGFDLRKMRTAQESGNGFARGTITFQSVYTAQLATNSQGQLAPVNGTGNSFADFLLGMPRTALSDGTPRLYYRYTQFEPYFADTWKIHPKFTLNLGISYYLATPLDPQGSSRQLPHNFDFSSGRLLYAALGDIDPAVYATDRNNFAPRVGLAWRVAPDTVVRSGFGIFYGNERVLDNVNISLTPGLTTRNALENPLFNPLPTYVFGQNVFPPSPIVPITREFVDGVRGAINAFPDDRRTAYVEQWTFSIQRSFGQNNLLEAAYIGNQAHRLNLRSNLNDCSVPDSLRCDPRAVPFPKFSPYILFYGYSANSSYHALNLKFNRQLSQGFSFLANYTWSKAIQNGVENGGKIVRRGACTACDRGLAALDVPQRLVTSLLWELPLGRGKRFLANSGRLGNTLVGGWSVNSIATFSMGTPFTVFGPGVATLNTPVADRICNGRDSLGNKDLRSNGFQYLDTNCFATPQPGFFGNSGVNILHGPGVNNWDIGIRKNFKIAEAVRMELAGEFFNAFNHAQFTSNPDTSVTSPNFGRVLNTRPNRQIQLGMKVTW
ncbi:MAG: TonB-dependent receptor [Acidobacteriota bacterium]